MLSSAQIQEKKPIPVRYICPITQQIMFDPVLAADGRNYEREAIETWLNNNATSPITNEVLPHKNLTTNFDKRSDILEYLEERPELYAGDDVYLSKASITTLIAAIENKQLSVVEQCLTKDKRLLSIKLENNYTAWHLACQYGSPEIITLLLKKLTQEQLATITQDNPAGYTPTHANSLLEQVLQQQNITQANLLLSLGADLEQLSSDTNNSLLQRCIIQGNQVATTWLLDKKANLEHSNQDGNTPLLIAVLYKHANIVKLLLQQGADAKHNNNAQFNAISLAALNNSTAILQLLLDNKEACLPPLHLALALNDLALLKALLAQNTDLETVDTKQCTPLYVAVSNNDLAATKLLLAKGANPNASCNNKLTPLHAAVMHNNLAATKLLLAKGANPNASCNNKLTPLHAAVMHNNLAIVTMLLATKINLDAADVDGNTSLHLTAKFGNDQIIEPLLKAGAYHKAINNDFQTPLKLAKQAGKIETARLILQTLRSLKQASKQSTLMEVVNLHQEISKLKQEKIAIEQAQLSRIAQLEIAFQLTKCSVDNLEDRVDAEVRAKAELEAAKTREAKARAKARARAKAKAATQQQIIASKLPAFLKLVVEGEQDQAEAMLKETPELAMYPGNVTDLSGRIFNNITGFQYAVWALDWHMWKMILRYLPEDTAREQMKGLETGSWVAEHGKSASWQNLIDALGEFIKLCNENKWNEATAQWNGAVGNAQQQLPVHVVNQYCHPTRSFNPCPNFKESVLPRSRQTDKGDWFTCLYSGDRGKNVCGIMRGPSHVAVAGGVGMISFLAVMVDLSALVSYLKNQTQLREQLSHELANGANYSSFKLML